MRFRKNNIGVFLAILAGVIAFGIGVWPFGAPQTATQVGPQWLVVVFGAGIAFIAAAFLADRSPTVARVLLVVGALAMFASGAFFGGLMGEQWAPLAVALDAVPGILALIAAFLIGPMQTGPRSI